MKHVNLFLLLAAFLPAVASAQNSAADSTPVFEWPEVKFKPAIELKKPDGKANEKPLFNKSVPATSVLGYRQPAAITSSERRQIVTEPSLAYSGIPALKPSGNSRYFLLK